MNEFKDLIVFEPEALDVIDAELIDDEEIDEDERTVGQGSEVFDRLVEVARKLIEGHALARKLGAIPLSFHPSVDRDIRKVGNEKNLNLGRNVVRARTDFNRRRR